MDHAQNNRSNAEDSDALKRVYVMKRNARQSPCLIFRCALLSTSLVFYEASAQQDPNQQAAELSRRMNSIPPDTDYFCVSNGPSNRILHPDRAPYTHLAEQDGVILFSGTAPQQGLNFQLGAGALVYRNQCSTIGSAEPSPQVGTAGTLQQRSDQFFLPWTGARWHQGEDISWQGYRHDEDWYEGTPHFFWTNREPEPICDDNA